jgi:hypothetical protein
MVTQTQTAEQPATAETAETSDREGRRDLRFNNYSIPEGADSRDHYANDPVWHLQSCEVAWWAGRHELEGELFTRGRPERTRGRRIATVGASELGLDPAALMLPLQFSYCAYLLRDETTAGERLAAGQAGATHEAGEPGRAKRDLPPQPRTTWQRRHELPAGLGPHQGGVNGGLLGSDETGEAQRIRRLSQQEAAGEPLLYLFNLIVALEWEPDEEDARQLAWAFRRASDYLYDVSDGSMAFGQVLIGWGPAYMRAADIQIAASNRMQGRAWAGGIHELSKRKPIRLGRGEWRRTYAIPWDEPEGYRVIVHEWAHYALHLRDAYLDRIPVEQFSESGPRIGLRRAQGAPRTHLLVPKPYLLGLSILETIDGVSELSIRFDESGAGRVHASERELLDALYPSGIRERNQIQNGPGMLPLPLPQILLKGGPTPPTAATALLWPKDHLATLGLRGMEDAPGETRAPYDRCWLYVYRQGPERKLIAQGTLDIRAPLQAFRLLGAAPGDRLLAVVYGQNGQPTSYSGAVTADQPAVQRFVRHELPVTPLVEVLPKPFARTDAPSPDAEPEPVAVFVRLRETNWSVRPSKIWVCPLGDAPTEYDAEHDVAWHENAFTRMYGPCNTDALDGHVVLWYGETPVICTYSHGGNPPKHTVGAPTEPRPIDLPMAATLGAAAAAPPAVDAEQPTRLPFVPITAGSSDGNVRIYFEVERESDFRVADRAALVEALLAMVNV